MAFDGYHQKKNPDAMEKLFAEYLNKRLDEYLAILTESANRLHRQIQK